MADFEVAYRCGQSPLPDLRETAELAKQSILDYVPLAKPVSTTSAAGECAGSRAPEDVARAVTAILLASPSVRKPPARPAQVGVDDERRDRYIATQNCAEIERRAATCIRKREPVPCLMLWSPKKHWVFGEESAVDVAELVALRTLFDLHLAVRDAYAPGLHFHLRIEDMEHAFVRRAGAELEEDMERYISRLCTTIRVLGLETVFTVTRTTDLAKDDRVIEAWRSRLEQNLSAFRAYWDDSERQGLERFEQYASYKALAALGWQGAIPREMRDYYLGRIFKGYGQGTPDADAADRVLRNFAVILLHHQENLLRVGEGVQPLIVAFKPQAPGTPLRHMLGRLNLRFVPRRLGHSTDNAAPWSVKGCLHERKGRLLPTFNSWRRPLGSYSQVVAGTFELARGQHRVPIRADLLLNKKNETSVPQRERTPERGPSN